MKLKFQLDSSPNEENIRENPQDPFKRLSWQYYEHQFVPPHLKKADEPTITFNGDRLRYANFNQ